MAPLLALGISVLPAIAQMVGGPRAGRVTEDVKNVFQEVTGTADPEQARAVLEADPGKLDALRIRLAEIALAEANAERQALLEEQRAMLADVQSARAQTLALTQAGSRMAWMPAIITFLVICVFTACVWAVLREAIPQENRDMAFWLVGAIHTMAANVISYWVGTSRGAVEQRQAFQRLAAGGGASDVPFGPPKGGR